MPVLIEIPDTQKKCANYLMSNTDTISSKNACQQKTVDLKCY